MRLSNRIDQKRLDRLGEQIADVINGEDATLAEALSVCVATMAGIVSLVNCRACRESAARQAQEHMAEVMAQAIKDGPQELGPHHNQSSPPLH